MSDIVETLRAGALVLVGTVVGFGITYVAWRLAGWRKPGRY